MTFLKSGINHGRKLSLLQGLTIISLIILFFAIIIGNIAVRNEQSTTSKAKSIEETGKSESDGLQQPRRFSPPLVIDMSLPEFAQEETTTDAGSKSVMQGDQALPTQLILSPENINVPHYIKITRLTWYEFSDFRDRMIAPGQHATGADMYRTECFGLGHGTVYASLEYPNGFYQEAQWTNVACPGGSEAHPIYLPIPDERELSIRYQGAYTYEVNRILFEDEPLDDYLMATRTVINSPPFEANFHAPCDRENTVTQNVFLTNFTYNGSARTDTENNILCGEGILIPVSSSYPTVTPNISPTSPLTTRIGVRVNNLNIPPYIVWDTVELEGGFGSVSPGLAIEYGRSSPQLHISCLAGRSYRVNIAYHKFGEPLRSRRASSAGSITCGSSTAISVSEPTPPVVCPTGWIIQSYCANPDPQYPSCNHYHNIVYTNNCNTQEVHTNAQCGSGCFNPSTTPPPTPTPTPPRCLFYRAPQSVCNEHCQAEVGRNCTPSGATFCCPE